MCQFVSYMYMEFLCTAQGIRSTHESWYAMTIIGLIARAPTKKIIIQFDLCFNLLFDDFLPKAIPIRLWIHSEGLDLCLYLCPSAEFMRMPSIDEWVLTILSHITILSGLNKIKEKQKQFLKDFSIFSCCIHFPFVISCFTTTYFGSCGVLVVADFFSPTIMKIGKQNDIWKLFFIIWLISFC